VDLGPGIIDQIMDGIQRPLKVFAENNNSIFMPANANEYPFLDIHKVWLFKPSNKIKIGSPLTGGDILGTCFENDVFQEHHIMVPPKTQGKVVSIVEEGNYTCKDKIIELEYNGEIQKVFMSHRWPVRKPRPIVEKMASKILMKWTITFFFI
jgi:V-type H+-transporting ATPase subunit A